MRHEGGCLCGAVRYRIEGRVLESGLCHCRSCRLASGATPVAWVTVAREDFRLTAGTPVGHQSSPGVTRNHCGTCGSQLTYADGDRTLDVTTATLDAPEALPPVRESGLAHRVPWVAVDPSRPASAEGWEE